MTRMSILGQLDADSLRLRDRRARQRAGDFAKSIGLLGFALLAALYSNSAARDGRIAAAGLAAGVALVVSGWVGLRLVPRLAAGVEWSRLGLVSRYRITAEGYIYLGALAVVAVAAINTSNNLLYMVLSALLAVLLLSGFLSGLNLRQIHVQAHLPERCFAAQPFRMDLLLANEKQVFPTFSLHVEPAEPDLFHFSPFYLPVLKRRNRIHRRVEVTLRTRGRHQLAEVSLESAYPFGFLRRGGALSVQAECVAFPEILPAESMASTPTDIPGSSARLERGHGLDLYMIRDYAPSDSARRIDWKASAKTSSLKSREFALEDSHRITIVLDRWGRGVDRERFERLVSQAASYLVHLSRNGADIRFVSDDWESHQVRAESGLESVLYYLALVEMTDQIAAPRVHASEQSLIFSLRSPGPE